MKKNNSESKKHRRIPWKIISWVVVLLTIVGIIVGFSVNWSFPSWIFVSGSSTMQPLLQSISNIYKPSEITSEAGGSSVGIQNVLNNKKNMGAASKSPAPKLAGIPAYQNNPAVTGSSQDQWENEHIKTITIGWDGIGIVYKNTGSLYSAPNQPAKFVLTPQTIQWLYLSFAGYTQVNANNLIPGTQTITEANPSNSVVPFARSGGAMQSGTAESFVIDSRLLRNSKGDYDTKSVLNQMPANANKPSQSVQQGDLSVWEALENGKYGPLTHTTSESNLQTWQAVKGYTGPGIPMAYLSAGFIKNNYQSIIDAGFQVASYCTSDIVDAEHPAINLITFNKDGQPENNNVSKTYGWFRPLNLVMRADSPQYIQIFIQWILGNTFFDKSAYRQILDEQGFIPLALDQMLSMFNPDAQGPNNAVQQIYNWAQEHPQANYDDYLNAHPSLAKTPIWKGFWVDGDDYNLIKTPEYNLREQQQIWYGAIPTSNKESK